MLKLERFTSTSILGVSKTFNFNFKLILSKLKFAVDFVRPQIFTKTPIKPAGD